MSSNTSIQRDSDPPEVIARRRFLSRLSIGLGCCCAGVIGGPVAGFMVAPLFRKTPQVWRAVGGITDFKVGETVNVHFIDASPLPWAGVTAKTAAWLRRVAENDFVAFAVNCTHLGCPVRWLPDAQLFMCPCHGGVYNGDGRVAAGPPPKPLPRYQVRIREGRVEILTGPVPIE